VITVVVNVTIVTHVRVLAMTPGPSRNDKGACPPVLRAGVNSVISGGAREMTVSDSEFRAALGRFPTGVTVVATCEGKSPIGLTVNAFASISLDPPLVMVSIDRRSHLHDAIPRAGYFAASILTVEQQELSRRFAGQTAHRSDRFYSVSWRTESTGAPVLNGALAWVDCRVEAMYPGGDHSIVLGRVEALGFAAGEPLLYYRGRYGHIDLPADAALRKVDP
jgi:3-hydroxy-9,10-secoandrosta-1,3,5(10)-triene-9,17-dione monooxygenase reductase component